MPVLNTLGTPTKTVILNHESHKLHLEFQAAGTIRAGQLVVLGVDGRVSLFTDAVSASFEVLGVALQSVVIDQMVTIATRGYIVLYGTNTGSAALTTGAGKLGGVISATAPYYQQFTRTTDNAAGKAEMQGWVLDVATAAALQTVRFLVKN